ncbi:hypothetical protein [Mesorhizobium sp. CA7]|uniref:hypothetical protein n=1 Tax=Mesorhizobium sp. CA7 TaxID=588501 RepID=UPI001CCF7823|nr:hypothetical protein [Mesorhizobium sp. CA7]MBZ9815759.1 hypothetical protein [Mesorhizobium sp. CA7]
MTKIEGIMNGVVPGAAGGKIGFFWVVRGQAGTAAILAQAIDLAEGEIYGPSIVHPGGHFDFWSTMQSLGPKWLSVQKLSVELLSTEYEDWPRGRVSFSLESNRFILFVDPRLRNSSQIAMIRKRFCVPENLFDVRSDSHYQPVRSKLLEQW